MRSGNLKRGFPLFAFCSIITNIRRYCMEFFQVTEKVIYFRNEGELLKIEGWGKEQPESPVFSDGSDPIR